MEVWHHPYVLIDFVNIVNLVFHNIMRGRFLSFLANTLASDKQFVYKAPGIIPTPIDLQAVLISI